MARADQREETRRRLVMAAVDAFSDRGFEGASTRGIAAAAGTTQGLLTYHFATKDDLWRAAADQIFNTMRSALRPDAVTLGTSETDRREAARLVIRRYVLHAASHPHLFRFMIDAGDETNARRRWLVDTHLRRLYQGFIDSIDGLELGADPVLLPHVFYAMVGAGSLMFALGGEVAELVGIDVRDPSIIERHADAVAALLIPEILTPS